ncbi:MAG: Na+/H+ antiporter NhaA [Gammaproteobacteria bacterium]|nr:Na+/H+ antiporter NhaA [Pseudomonadales bacterium]MCP5348870.1 Na+/H+ antiporter NhaA [Pseudomonadales bacterium]
MEQDRKDNTSPHSVLHRGVGKLVRPLQYIIRDQKTASLLLLACALIALVIANSPLSSIYEELIRTPVGVVFGDHRLTMSLRHWINDALMSLFFFVIGLEIKRELLVGELRKADRAIPVIAAAIGGMAVPALIFVLINQGQDTLHGWAIPMATDTAFAIGVLTLLGKRVPSGLTAFLLALAIIDDMGAVLVIALFYTSDLDLQYLVLAFLALLILLMANRAGVRHPAVFICGGSLVWAAMLGSGVHSTLAGVLVALTVPARPARSPRHFVRKSRRLINEFVRRIQNSNEENPVLAEQDHHFLVERLQETAKQATTPLQLWERTMEHPVALLVLPVFALVNAGIPLQGLSLADVLSQPLALGIVLGLVAGKVAGILIATSLIVKLGWGRLPGGMQLKHTIGLGLLAGMGFTMSIFIAGLGFENSPQELVAAKTGIIAASLLAGLLGFMWLRFLSFRSNT